MTEELDSPNFHPSALGPKAVEELARRIPIDRVITLLENMMGAVMVSNSIGKAMRERGEAPPPDWRAREAAVKIYLSYVVGMPVQRQHLVKETLTTPTDPTQDLAASPAARAALARMLAASPEGRAAMETELKTIPA